jgi:alkylation response protein AidB-like acyl-CoA dehydrogenase
MSVSTSSAPSFADEREDFFLAGVRDIRDLLMAQAAKGEADGFLSVAVIDALDAIEGIWSMAVPQRLGGTGLSARSIARISAELAKGDPAAAWVVQIIGSATWVASLASDAVQDILFADGVPRICAVFGPPGTAVPVDGGYRVRGRWPYASGCAIARWAQLAVAIERDDGTRTPGAFCYIPLSELEIQRTWQTTGLQATGSDTLVTEDLFVPYERTITPDRPLGMAEGRTRHCGAPSDYWTIGAFVGRTGTGQAIGIAEAMLEQVATGLDRKTIAGTTFARASDSQVIARDIGEAAAQIATARLLVEETTGRLDAAALARTPLDFAARAQSRALGNLAIKLVDSAAQSLMFIGGSSALSIANPLSRYWRDLAMVTRHVQNIPNLGFEVHGRALLNIQPNLFLQHLI